MKKLQALLIFSGLWVPFASSIDIVVDYSYDSNNFFDTQDKRDAMEEVADRFSRVITSSLAAVGPEGTGTGTPAGWRIGFLHPGTGDPFEISTAASAATDSLIDVGAPEADVYGFAGLSADVWILYAGGRPLASSGNGGTATGNNFLTTFDDVNGPLHRGFNDNTPGAGPTESSRDLPRWGGSITFDTGRTWHFDRSTIAPPSASDFYSIALHEIGHALGLSTDWNQWAGDGAGNYTGAEAIAAYNSDNGTTVTSLDLVGAGGNHFADQTYDSFVFSEGSPETVGVVPNFVLQDLLMEPIADFGGQQNRFELTNVDVAALRDLGWATLTKPIPNHQPDNIVGKNLFSSIGSNIYETATGQTLTLISRKARKVNGVFGVSNDGAIPDEMTVTGTGGNSIFTVTYTSGGNNITAEVVTGIHTTGLLFTGDPPEQINVTIKHRKSKIKKIVNRRGRKSIRYRKRSRTLTVRSVSDGNALKSDLCRLIVRTK
jgi:hypothetical protein